MALAACFKSSISVYRQASRSEYLGFVSSSPFPLIFLTAAEVAVIQVLALNSSTAVSLGADEQESHPTSPSSDSLCRFTASGTALGMHERVHPSTSEHTCRQACCAWSSVPAGIPCIFATLASWTPYKTCSVRYRVL